MTERLPRYIPEGGALVEITYRTVQGRYLLRPGPTLNELVVGVLARAQELCPTVELVGIVVLSNHLHLLLSVPDQYQLSTLMWFFGGNLAKEVNREHDWSGKLWSRRYRSICVTEEPAAQIERLEYLLSQAVKEDLVKKVEDWPGIHFGKTLMEGRSLLVGAWYDRTKQYRAAVQGKKIEESEYRTELTVELKQLPCWRDLPWDRYVRRIRKMIRRIEKEAERERELQGATVVGAPLVRQQDPHTRPRKMKKGPAPLVHAATQRERIAWRESFGIFVAAYRFAADLLREGVLEAPFPEGCFPPALPYVGDRGGGEAEPAPA